MGGFFNLDGPFYKFGNTVWDIMALSMLWFFFSIPIFTIGASSTALFYITTRRLSKKEGYITRDFWISFKQNFKQSTKIWLSVMAIGILLISNLYFMLFKTEQLNMPPTMLAIMLPLQALFLIELCLFSLYAFPIISRFEIRGKMLIKTTMLMAHKHLPTTILLAALFAIIVITMLYGGQILILLFGAGIYAYCASHLLVRLFKKYRPEIDKDEEMEALNI